MLIRLVLTASLLSHLSPSFPTERRCVHTSQARFQELMCVQHLVKMVLTRSHGDWEQTGMSVLRFLPTWRLDFPLSPILRPCRNPRPRVSSMPDLCVAGVASQRAEPLDVGVVNTVGCVAAWEGAAVASGSPVSPLQPQRGAEGCPQGEGGGLWGGYWGGKARA